MSDRTIEITNDKGRPFLVRLVFKGDRYGLDDKLIHDEADPMIEFYDLTTDPERFGERGQFVSRYNAHTLAAMKEGMGICLYGAEPEVWSIDGVTLAPVLKLARLIAVCKPGSWDRCLNCPPAK